jgi:hypothetical protein
MRKLRTNILCSLLIPACAYAQEPSLRVALPDSAAIANYTKSNHERILFRFRIMRLGSWQYVWDDSTTRHYGPTAQEFFAAFGADSIGTIGNEKGMAPADVAGIAMIAIQALEDRTQYLRAALADKDEEIKDLRSQLTEMKTVAWKIRVALNELYLNNVRLQNRLDQIEKATANAEAKMSSLK